MTADAGMSEWAGRLSALAPIRDVQSASAARAAERAAERELFAADLVACLGAPKEESSK